MIRLPEQCLDVIGETAQIYAIEQKGMRGFFVALQTLATDERNVAQLLAEVAQPKVQNDIEARLLELESELRELRSVILPNRCSKDNHNKKGAQKDGLEAIRTGDLRRVKAMS
jgi:hypothetical protein